MSLKAVYPGTFDPITLGHLDIIKRASKLVDTLFIAISNDNEKNSIFSQNERFELISQEIKNLNLLNVEVVMFNGLLTNFLQENKINFIIRGIRSISDFENEFTIATMNRKLYNNVETIFLPTTDSTQFISASLVKQISKLGGDISSFVSENVKNNIEKKLKDFIQKT